jgi:hypothetical protein
MSRCEFRNDAEGTDGEEEEVDEEEDAEDEAFNLAKSLAKAKKGR